MLHGIAVQVQTSCRRPPFHVGSHPDNACLPPRRWHEYARRMRAYFMTAHDDDDDVDDDILRLPPGEKAHAAWVSQEL